MNHTPHSMSKTKIHVNHSLNGGRPVLTIMPMVVHRATDQTVTGENENKKDEMRKTPTCGPTAVQAIPRKNGTQKKRRAQLTAKGRSE